MSVPACGAGGGQRKPLSRKLEISAEDELRTAAAAVRMSANSTQSANRSPRVAEMPHAAAVRKGVSAFKGAAIVLALALACTLPSGVAANTPMESTSKALSSGAHIKHVDAKAQVNQIAWRRRGISHTRKLFNFPLPSRPMRRNPRPKPGVRAEANPIASGILLSGGHSSVLRSRGRGCRGLIDSLSFPHEARDWERASGAGRMQHCYFWRG